MYSTLFTTTLFFVLAALGVRAEFDVATVDLTQVSDSPKEFSFFPFSVTHFVSSELQCKPATLSWANTTGPYNVIIVSSDKPCDDALYVVPILLVRERLPT